MKTIGFVFLLFFFTACSQNVGAGVGVAGISTSGNNAAATEIFADTETGLHGSISMGTGIRL
jgi:hypothetical protein